MRCSHADAVPVESVVTGEVLAALCPGCDVQLPAEFLTCPHENVIDTPALNQRPGLGICNDCGVSAWYDRPQALITFGGDVNAEDLAALKARFRVVADHNRLYYLPYVASLDAPTITELL